MSRGKISKGSMLNASPRRVVNTELSKNELVDQTKVELPLSKLFKKVNSPSNESLSVERTDQETKLYASANRGYEGERGGATLTNDELAEFYDILEYAIDPNHDETNRPEMDEFGRYEFYGVDAQIHLTIYDAPFDGNIAAISIKDSWDSARYSMDLKELKQLMKALRPQR